MDGATVFLGWTALGAGIILAYSAYKNEGPLSVLTGGLNGTSTRTTINGGTGSAATSNLSVGNATAQVTSGADSTPTSSRAAAIKAKTIKPVYVNIPGHGALVLDQEAAASFARVEAAYGKTIALTGASRSAATQILDFAENPGVFGKPGTSLHEVGLAVDVSSTMNLQDPALIQAFTSNGWFRRGKVLANGQPEPWHWSYGVPG